MAGQKTFTLLPDLRAAAVNNAPIRPMTSKQVKKAHKAANKQPKLSRAEQRRLELAEQERIRKEFERERAATKAKAARERKKEKELAQKELRKKAGRPLVDVRPSQDTISRFFRGNGSGKKRDEQGTEVAAPMPVVAEETEAVLNETPDPNPEHEAELVPDYALEPGIGGGADQEQAPDEEADGEPDQDPGRESDRELDQEIDDEINQEIDLELDQELHQDPSQELDQDLKQLLDGGPELQQNSRSQPDPGLEDLLEDIVNQEDMQKEPTMANAIEEPEEIQAFIATCPEDDGELEELLRKETVDCVQPICPETDKLPPSDGRSGSFCLDSDEMIDDHSLIELTETLENVPDTVERLKTPTVEMESRPLDPEPGLPILSNTNQDEDKDYGVVHISTEEELDLFRETETRIPKVVVAPVTNPVIPEPRRSQRRPFTRQVSSFFLESSLDDDLLLQLELPGETKLCQSGQIRDRPAPEVPAVVEEDFDDIPTPSPVSRRAVPLSTQAILLNFNDYLPSATQLALELEDDLLDDNDTTVLPNEFHETSPQRQPVESPLEEEAASNSAVQRIQGHASPQRKRFFTSSGSNERLQLAKHLSRRSAALEEIQRRDRLRYERRPHTSRGYVQKSPPSEERATSSSLPCLSRRDKPIHNVKWAKLPPKNVQSTTEAASTQTKWGNTNTPRRPEPSQKRLFDKENIGPEDTTNDLSCRSLPPASQETEYGGAWVDDVGLDLMC